MKQFIKDPSSFSKRRIDNMCANDTLDEQFIRKYSLLLNWNILSACQNLSKDILIDFASQIEWLYYFQHHDISEEFIREFIDIISWKNLCTSNCELSYNFIREYSDKIDWTTFSRWKKLEPHFMEEVKDKCIFSLSLFHQRYSEEFINKHLNKFINDYLDKHYVWTVIPQTQRVSEQFIEKWKDKINWEEVCRYQKLSSKFLDEHTKYLIWEIVEYNQDLEEWFIEEHIDKLNFDKLLTRQNLSQKFMEKYSNRINWLESLHFYWDSSTNYTYTKGKNTNLTKKFVIKMLKQQYNREKISNYNKSRIEEIIKYLRKNNK